MPERIGGPQARLMDLMRSPASEVPLVMALVLVNGLVFVAMLAAGAGLWHTANGVPLAWGANFGPATQDGQWWRLFTALFVHFGVVHLAMNMWALWDVGRLMERLYGPWRLALLYFGSGVLGNLLSLVVQGNQAVSGGASGAVFSLYGALLVFLWRERGQVERFEFRWLFGAATLFTALMLGMGFMIPGIDNAAHGGGLVAGALWGWLLARPWTAGSPEVKGNWFAGLFLAAGVALLITKLPVPAYRFSEEVTAQTAIADFMVRDAQINRQWEGVLNAGQRGAASFEQLAGGVEIRVVAGYERSFEQLLEATPHSDVPSADRLAALQQDAQERAAASRQLADGLRANDPMRIRQAVQQAQAASKKVKAAGESPKKAASAPWKKGAEAPSLPSPKAFAHLSSQSLLAAASDRTDQAQTSQHQGIGFWFWNG